MISSTTIFRRADQYQELLTMAAIFNFFRWMWDDDISDVESTDSSDTASSHTFAGSDDDLHTPSTSPTDRLQRLSQLENSRHRAFLRELSALEVETDLDDLRPRRNLITPRRLLNSPTASHRTPSRVRGKSKKVITKCPHCKKSIKGNATSKVTKAKTTRMRSRKAKRSASAKRKGASATDSLIIEDRLRPNRKTKYY
jgi:hypothetical protein